tara:strand:+ start:93 stop:989 length:897 start_codon:yes stop_codon:yes gene_type:complete
MNLNTSIEHKYIYEHLTSESNPIGIVHISHGMAEHIGRYNWLIKKLNKDGFHVIAIDQRGHGRRIVNNIKGYFADSNGWNYVINDQKKLVDDTKKKYPHLNQYMIAHSMGSWIALGAIQEGMKVDGLILSGSSRLPDTLIKVQKILIKFILLFSSKKRKGTLLDKLILGKYNKFFSPNRTPKDWISSDTSNVDEYISDPLCGYEVTNGLWQDLAHGISTVFDEEGYKDANKSMPIFIISGANDPVGENGKGVKRLNSYLKNIFKNVSLALIPNARHEVFSEINKESNYKLLKIFMDSC